jgi:hypothetical protein
MKLRKAAERVREGSLETLTNSVAHRFIQSKQLPVYDLTVGRNGKAYYRVKRSDFEN